MPATQAAMNFPTHAAAPRRGLTPIECMVTVAVSAVVAGTAVPSLRAAMERRQLEGAAAQLQTDLALARSAAMAANRSLRISFEKSAAGSC
jgi:type IV fimbrial biogenesis protein FimT